MPSCIDCGADQVATRQKDRGVPESWIVVWVCPDCHPGTVRRWPAY